MADNMIRNAVRGNDGTAKPMHSDDLGNIHVQNIGNQSIFVTGKMKKLALPTPDGTNNEAVHFTCANAYIPKGLNGYKYWGAFTPFYKIEGHTNDYTENPCIVASNDGINWEVPAGVTNPLFGPPESGYYADVSLLWDGAKLYLYWQHFGVNPGHTYRSESSDGINWSEPTECVTESGYPVTEVFFKVDTNKWLAFDRDCNITYSKDGIHWGRTHYTHSNLDHQIGQTYHLGVFNDGMRFHFLTNKSAIRPSAGLGDQTFTAIYHGVSEDGTYITYDPTPVWVLDEDTFMTDEIRRAEICYGNNLDFYMYVFGRDSNRKYWTGVVPVRFGNIKPFEQKESLVVAFDGEEIRDTTVHYSSFGDSRYYNYFTQIGKYKHKCIEYRNLTDQEITLGFRGQTTGQTMMFGDANQTVTLKKYAYKSNYIGSDDLAILHNKFYGDVQVYVKADTAPTSGKLYVNILCWND